jgi:peptide/nickel transport system substrate-binding protein
VKRSLLNIAVAAALFTTFAFAGCAKVETQSADAGGRKNAWTVPHVFRYATAEDLVGLNPALNTQATLSYLAEMTGAFLIKTDKFGEPTVPELITEIPSKQNGGISADGLSITWKLRHGVKWSDGTDFTADDVVWSTNEINNPRNNVISHDGWDLIKKIDEPDKYTVVYHLSKPYGSFAVTFFSSAGANPCVMPKHAFDPNAKDINNAPYNALPIGIGPFKYKEWKRGDAVTLVADPLYFRGEPKIKEVVFKLIPDRDTVVAQLRSHELDAFLPISPHYFNQVKAIDGYVTSNTPSYTYDHLDFNTSHPVLADPVVRRALRMAMDRKTILDKIDFGLYSLQESVVPVASKVFFDPIPQVPFDIAGANKMLDGAGWKRGADGIRAKGALRMSFDLATSAASHDTDQEIELIRGTWSQVGVELNVKHYLPSLLFGAAATGGIIYGGHFDIVLFGWGGDPNEDLSNLYACYRFPPDGQNDLRWCDRDLTAAIDRAKVQYDREVRKPDMKFAQERIFEAAPTIVLWSRKELRAYNSDVKNWEWISNPTAPFDHMIDVDI